MTTQTLDWKLVTKCAEAIGISKDTRKKWRQRGYVPSAKWFDILEQSAGAISIAALKKAATDAKNRREEMGDARI